MAKDTSTKIVNPRSPDDFLVQELGRQNDDPSDRYARMRKRRPPADTPPASKRAGKPRATKVKPEDAMPSVPGGEVDIKAEKDNTFDERLFELGQQIQDKIADLRQQNEYWQPDVSFQDRDDMIMARVLRTEEYTDAETEAYLTAKGRQEFLKKIPELRGLNADYLALQSTENVLPDIQIAQQAARERDRLRAQAALRSKVQVEQTLAFLSSKDQADDNNADSVANVEQVSEMFAPEFSAKDLDIPQAEVQADLDEDERMLEEVAESLRNGQTIGVQEKLDEILEDLNLETKRILGLEKTETNEHLIADLESRMIRLRRSRQSLLRKMREVSRRDPVDSGVEQVVMPEQLIVDQLKGVQAKIEQTHEMLQIDDLDVRGIHEFMGGAETDLSQVLTALEAEREAGNDVAILEAGARATLSDLRRLQDKVKKVVDRLSTADLINEYNPGDFKKELAKDVSRERESKEMAEAKVRQTKVSRERVENEVAQDAALVTAKIDPKLRGSEDRASKGWFAQSRESWGKAMSYIRNGWRNFGESQLRAVAEPEVASGELSMTDRAAVLIDGIVVAGINAKLSHSGLAVIPDAVRYFSQKSYTQSERTKIERQVKEAMDWQARKEQITGEFGGDEEIFEGQLARRRSEIVERIQNLPYDQARKDALLQKVEDVLDKHRASAEKIHAQHSKEVAKLLEAYITTNVSGAKVAKEAANSALVAGSYFAAGPVALAGLALARGATYSIGSLNERYLNAQAEVARGERKATSLRDAVANGFKQAWSNVTLQSEGSAGKKVLNSLKTWAQLGRAAGMSAAVFEGVRQTDIADKVLDWYESISGSSQPVEGAMRPVVSPDFHIPEPTPEVVASPIEINEPYRGEIPVGSRIEEILDSGLTLPTDDEGITYPLRRVIAKDPEAYGYDPETMGVSPAMFAKLEAMKIADRDTGMAKWLTKKAVGKLNIFPEKGEDGMWHIASIVDGKRLSLKQLAEQGYLMDAPASSK